MRMLYIILAVGTMLMFLCMWLGARKYEKIPVWKVLVSSVLLTATGVLGTHVMFFIETGDWGGNSFFGAVFLIPILMFPVAKILKCQYADIVDLCAPAECIMLALMKVQCTLNGCCYGKFFKTANYAFRFPSQKVECVAALVLFIVLMALIFTKSQKGRIYPWYLIIYGIIRFILNLFRDTIPWIGPLAAGNFWSVIAIVVGVTWMVILLKKQKAMV